MRKTNWIARLDPVSWAVSLAIAGCGSSSSPAQNASLDGSVQDDTSTGGADGTAEDSTSGGSSSGGANGGSSSSSSGSHGASSSGGGSSTSSGSSSGGSHGASSASSSGGSGSSSGGAHGASSSGAGSSTSSGSSSSGSHGASSASSSGGGSSGGGSSGGDSGADAGYPAGWLYTRESKIYLSSGSGSDQPWMGRGVNTDDIFFCGYNGTLWMTSPEQDLETVVSGLISGWKPNFLRVSLAMDTDPTVTSWLSDAAQYKTPMTAVINAIGTNPGVYVLVTLRSDASMIGLDTADGDPEATGLPSSSTTTPDATSFPTGTDATYIALVDTFANSNFVLFGLSNEPGGDTLTDATIAAAMEHAVGVIRSEEDRLGVPHHIVSVQGNGWTSDISFYAASPAPITYDNVVYEVHGYPPATSSYTYSNIPVILGEYGSLTSGTSAAFYADLETKQISSLAWDVDPYSPCAPDLVNVTQNATPLTPSAWGTIVQSYLLAHSP